MRKVIDCREFPSDTGCTLLLSGVQSELLQSAAEHAVSVHLEHDGPELRKRLLAMMKDDPTELGERYPGRRPSRSSTKC